MTDSPDELLDADRDTCDRPRRDLGDLNCGPSRNRPYPTGRDRGGRQDDGRDDLFGDRDPRDTR